MNTINKLTLEDVELLDKLGSFRNKLKTLDSTYTREYFLSLWDEYFKI